MLGMDNLKNKPDPIENILNRDDIEKINEISRRDNVGDIVEGENSKVNPDSRRLKRYLIIGGFVILSILASYRLTGGEDNCIRIANHQPSKEYINNQLVPSDYKNLQNSYQ